MAPLGTAPQGSNGSNVLAAIASFFLPGLGQLAQGRVGAGFMMFCATIFVWGVTLGLLGWVMHIVAALEAAVYKPQ
jgi:TM2 domain-containing membrane protein YozV